MCSCKIYCNSNKISILDPIFFSEAGHHPRSAAVTESTSRIHPTGRLRQAQSKMHGSLVLTMLALSSLICWVPCNAFYSVLTVDPDQYVRTVDVVTTSLLLMQTLVDPILLGLVIPDVRKTVQGLILGRLPGS